MPLQLGGQGGLPALQGGCQSPQKGCPGTWGLVYPARGGLVSSFHGTSDILGSTLGHVAMEIAMGILDGPGTPGARSLETAPNEEPIGGC